MSNATNVSKVHLVLFDSNKGLNRGASKLTEICWYLIKMLFFLSSFPFPKRVKMFWLKVFGAKVGKGVIIKPRVNIHMPWKLTIGNDVWIGEEAFILNFEPVIIGSNVCISQRAFLCCGNHDFNDPAMSYRNGPITLEDGAWIGASCFVAPNITIATDSVIVACSFVTKSTVPRGIYQGNPAVLTKKRW